MRRWAVMGAMGAGGFTHVPSGLTSECKMELRDTSEQWAEGRCWGRWPKEVEKWRMTASCTRGRPALSETGQLEVTSELLREDSHKGGNILPSYFLSFFFFLSYFISVRLRFFHLWNGDKLALPHGVVVRIKRPDKWKALRTCLAQGKPSVKGELLFLLQLIWQLTASSSRCSTS